MISQVPKVGIGKSVCIFIKFYRLSCKLFLARFVRACLRSLLFNHSEFVATVYSVHVVI